MNQSGGKSFLKNFSGKRQNIALGGILAVAVVQSVMQLSFIQNEKLRLVEVSAVAPFEKARSEKTLVETKQPDRRIVEIKPEEYEIKTVKVITIPEKTQPVLRRQSETVQPQPKRKIVRESKAERLRRAEKILTGI